MPKPFISIVIPAYNEAPRIAATVERLTSFLATRPWTWEALVVSDGSTDGTVAAAAGIASREPRVRVIDAAHGGKGAAVKRGLTEALGEWRFMCDADLAMPPEHLDRFFPGPGRQPKWDITLGSREAPGARRTGEPSRRHIFGRVFNYWVKLIALRGINDTQCGFKLFSGRAVEAVFPHQRLHGFGFDVEVLFIARKAGLSIGETPIDWHYGGRSSMTLRKGALGFWDVARVRLNHIMGRYRAVKRVK